VDRPRAARLVRTTPHSLLQSRSRRFIACRWYIEMKWNIAVAVATGFVLAIGLIFGGRAMSGQRLVKSDKDSAPNSSDCCTR
jgi:hypothetical protein